MQVFLNTIKDIVVVVQAVFGFLPPWVSVFIGSCTLIVLGLIAYKLIRG